MLLKNCELRIIKIFFIQSTKCGNWYCKYHFLYWKFWTQQLHFSEHSKYFFMVLNKWRVLFKWSNVSETTIFCTRFVISAKYTWEMSLFSVFMCMSTNMFHVRKLNMIKDKIHESHFYVTDVLRYCRLAFDVRTNIRHRDFQYILYLHLNFSFITLCSVKRLDD